MPSIIEEITAAEQEAQQSRKQAAANNRQRVADAASLGAKRVAAARDNARADMDEARLKAEDEGEALAESIARENAEAARALIDAAKKNADKAADLIIERASK